MEQYIIPVAQSWPKPLGIRVMQETEELYWGQHPKYFGWTKLEWFIPFDFWPKFQEFWSEWKAGLNPNELAKVCYIQELQVALRMLFIITTCSLLYRGLLNGGATLLLLSTTLLQSTLS